MYWLPGIFALRSGEAFFVEHRMIRNDNRNACVYMPGWNVWQGQHKTESVYRRYAIVSKSDLEDATRRLDALADKVQVGGQDSLKASLHK
jgi:hypothetical protein